MSRLFGDFEIRKPQGNENTGGAGMDQFNSEYKATADPNVQSSGGKMTPFETLARQL